MTNKLKTHFKHFVIGSLISALGAGTYVIAAVTFSDFTGGTTISASEMNAKLNAIKDAINANRVTRLHYDGTNTDSTVTTNYEQLRAVGSFTKAFANSRIELTWIGHATVNGTFCEHQLRIDGAKDTGSTSTSFEPASGGSAIVYSAEAPISVSAIFGGLTAGTHTVSIWLRGGATSCTLNTGNFGQTVLVRESAQDLGIGTLTALVPASNVGTLRIGGEAQ